MKRLIRSWVFWACIVPLGGLPFFCGRFEEEEYSTCRCGSERLESWPRMGIEALGTFRSGGRRVRESESELRLHVLDGTHRHLWGVEYGWTRPAEAVVRGVPTRSSSQLFTDLCRERPEFLAWLKAQRASGAIPASQVEAEIDKRLDYSTAPLPFGWTP